MSFQIIEIETNEKENLDKLIAYLSSHESRALFLLGNLKNNLQSSQLLYAAEEKGKIVAICGYYPLFKSCSIFSENEAASRTLAKAIIKKHLITALLGMADIARPFLEEMLIAGFRLKSNPEDLFFELEMKDFKPYKSAVGEIRPLEEKDIERAVLLTRHIHSPSSHNAISPEEKKRMLAMPVKFGFELDDKIVSVASSNGMAIKQFQILGVATDPAYRRRGFAKAVCSHLILHMKKQGATKAILFTQGSNIAAKKCYLDLGFKITDRYTVALFD